MAIIELFAGNVLPFSNQTGNSPEGGNTFNLLQFTSTVKISPIKLSQTQTLNLGHSVILRKSINNQSINQSIGLWHQSSPTPGTQSITQFLFFYHSARTVKYETPNSVLQFLHSAVGNVAKGTITTLTFINTTSWNLIRNPEIEQLLSFLGFGVCLKYDANFIATIQPTLITRDHTTLTFGSISIDIRNPDFGDEETIGLMRVNHNTIGGDKYIFRDSSWPKEKKKKFVFSYLSQEDTLKLKNFVKQSLGKKITLIDYETKTYEGIILTPACNIIQGGRKNYQAEFDFLITG